MATDHRYYYELLGVAQDASPAEIEQACQRLSLKYHPDKNFSDVEATFKFKQVQDAYEVLLQPERRKPVGGFHTPASAFLAVKFHRDAIRRDTVGKSNNFVPPLVAMATTLWLAFVILCGLLVGISPNESGGAKQASFITGDTVLSVSLLVSTVLYVMSVLALFLASRPR